MLNIEKSAFHKGEYVGYRNGDVYRIRNLGKRRWCAHLSSTWRPMADSPLSFYAETLRELSAKLAS